MARRIGFIAAWVVATFATGLVAWGAVRIAGSQVADGAVRPLSAAEVEALPTTSEPLLASSPSVTQAPAGSTSARVATSPAADDIAGPAVAASPTTPPPPPSTITTTTSNAVPGTPPTTATTSPSTSASEVKTYQTGGGSVTIVVSPGIVELGGASPGAGFKVEVEDDGPHKVEVKFESTSEDEADEYEFHAKWEDGRLVVEID